MEFRINKGVRPYGGRKLVEAVWHDEAKTLVRGFVYLGGLHGDMARGPRLYRVTELTRLD